MGLPRVSDVDRPRAQLELQSRRVACPGRNDSSKGGAIFVEAPPLTPRSGSRNTKYGKLEVARRSRATAAATRLVSHVSQRRPNRSALIAVVPDPHVGSTTRSPAS